MTTWFITRHPGARDWARRQGFRIDRFIDHLDVAEVRAGDSVMGSLPVHLAAEVCRRGARYFHLTLSLPPDSRGRELTAEELEACGADLREFTVTSGQKDPES